MNLTEFNNLCKEERHLRGRLSTLIRMIKKREDKVDKLYEPIKKLKDEIGELKSEMIGLKSKIKNQEFSFPIFRIEEYTNSDRDYFRAVWYVKSVKKQKYLGSVEKLLPEVKSKFKDEFLELETSNLKFQERYEKQMELVTEYFLPTLQLDYWKKEYEDFKKI